MNVLSLFDGIACGRIALERAGIKPSNYFASEIDEDAILIAKSNHSDIKYIGDVREVERERRLPHINLLIGGSPCQSFSSFGDGSGFNGKSGLFWEYARIKKQVNPDWFLLENVNMKKEWIDIISEEMGVAPIAINSNLVSAQNRDRLYWTNIPNVTIPEDKGIMFCDILEDLPFRDIPKCFFSMWGKEKRIDKGLNWVKNKKGNCLTTKNCHGNQYILNEAKDKIRLLTTREAEIMQTLPIGYSKQLSDMKRFKAIGNGWTIDVIAHIFKGLKDAPMWEEL